MSNQLVSETNSTLTGDFDSDHVVVRTTRRKYPVGYLGKLLRLTKWLNRHNKLSTTQLQQSTRTNGTNWCDKWRDIWADVELVESKILAGREP